MKTHIAIALIVLFTAGLLLGWEIGVASRPVKEPPPHLVPVLAAQDDIPAGTNYIMLRNLLTTKLFLRESVPPACCSHLDVAKGKLLGRNLYAGDPVRTNDFSQPGVGWRTAPPGVRAVTIRIPAEELPPATPGTARVDILFTYQDVKGNSVTAMLLENVKVFAANSIRTTVNDGSGCCSIENLAVVTVAAKPVDAARIVWAKENGRLSVILRQAEDEEIVRPPAVTEWPMERMRFAERTQP